MAGLIPQLFIDDLINRVDIIEVIDAHVPLKKTGRDYSACCPFHNEKTPSFTVSPVKQFYYCFGCGAHGTALTFLMEYGRMDFVEAVESLASQQGMEVPREQGTPTRQSNADLYELLEQVTAYYCQQLKYSQAAIDYLKSRGLNGETAAEYGLGYAPSGWNNLTPVLGKDKHAELLKSGMLTRWDNGDTHDRFRERLMFPIRDQRGRTIGFGGRITKPDSSPAKYLNSPETPLFHKSRELYGLYEARKAVRKLESFYIVEGYIDVIAMAQNGMRNVVATMGTAITAEHLKKLFKIAPAIIFCFDGDRAGRDAAWRALENTLPVMRDGRMVRFLFLPDGEDPDSMIRQHGRDVFERLTGEAQTLSEYFFAHLDASINSSTPDGRAQLVKQAQPLLQKLPGGVFYDLMLDELSKRTELSVERLVEITTLVQQPTAGNPGSPIIRKEDPSVRLLITLLLQQPSLAQLAHNIDGLAGYNVPGAALLAELLDFLKDKSDIHPGVILEHWRNSEYGQHLAKLAQRPVKLEEHRLETEFKDNFCKLGKYAPLHRDQIIKKMIQGCPLTAQEKSIIRKDAKG